MPNGMSLWGIRWQYIMEGVDKGEAAAVSISKIN
jgi:hypothetical protein